MEDLEFEKKRSHHFVILSETILVPKWLAKCTRSRPFFYIYRKEGNEAKITRNLICLTYLGTSFTLVLRGRTEFYDGGL